MGLLTGLLTLPLAPARGAGWVIGQLIAEAERQYTDPEPIRLQLAALYADLRAGLIDEEEFDRQEDLLLDELEARGGGRPVAWTDGEGLGADDGSGFGADAYGGSGTEGGR